MAQGIEKRLMCPVCPSETIDQSQVQLAKQMRDIVREKLAAGESREEIFQFFVDRYGTGVLAEPPRSGFNLLVWVVPPIALVFGGLVLAVALRAMRRSHDSGAPEDGRADEADLEPYLSAVDRGDPRACPVGRVGLFEHPDGGLRTGSLRRKDGLVLADLGYITLLLALVLASYSVMGSLVGAGRGSPQLVRSALNATYLAPIALGLSNGRSGGRVRVQRLPGAVRGGAQQPSDGPPVYMGRLLRRQRGLDSVHRLCFGRSGGCRRILQSQGSEAQPALRQRRPHAGPGVLCGGDGVPGQPLRPP